jgi:hypothetical protein
MKTNTDPNLTDGKDQNVDAIPVKKIDEINSQNDSNMKKVIYPVYIILIILGIGTGYILSGKGAQTSTSVKTNQVITTGKVVGSTDTSTFKDSAVGTVQKGGLGGEGTHQLVRDGGPSQTVYLISSVVDLDQFVGKKVKVWGQTMAAQKVAWLMDVGKVEQE